MNIQENFVYKRDYMKNEGKKNVGTKDLTYFESTREYKISKQIELKLNSLS